MSVPTYEKLQELTDEEVHDKIRELASMVPVSGPGTNELEAQIYLNELARRQQKKQTETIVNYTRWMTIMTAVILGLTVLLVVRELLACAH